MHVDMDCHRTNQKNLLNEIQMLLMISQLYHCKQSSLMKSTCYLLTGWVLLWLIRSTRKWYVSTRKASEKTLDSIRGRILCASSSTAFFYLRDQLCFLVLNSIYENTLPNNLIPIQFFWLARKDFTNLQHGSHVVPLLLV